MENSLFPNATKFGEVLLCDGECNKCKIVNTPNYRVVVHILNELMDKFGDEVYSIVQNHCPNLTVCYDCRIDDFCHVKDCEIIHHESESLEERTIVW